MDVEKRLKKLEDNEQQMAYGLIVVVVPLMLYILFVIVGAGLANSCGFEKTPSYACWLFYSFTNYFQL